MFFRKFSFTLIAIPLFLLLAGSGIDVSAVGMDGVYGHDDTPDIRLHRGDRNRVEEIPAELFSDILGSFEDAGERFRSLRGDLNALRTPELPEGDLFSALIGGGITVPGGEPGKRLTPNEFFSSLTSGYNSDLLLLNDYRETWNTERLVSALYPGFELEFNRLESRWESLRSPWQAGDLVSSLASAYGADLEQLHQSWDNIYASWQVDNLISTLTGGLSSEFQAWQDNWKGLRRAFRGENLLASALTGGEGFKNPGWVNPSRTCQFDSFINHKVPGLAEKSRLHTVRIPWSELRGAIEYDRFLSEAFTDAVSSLEEKSGRVEVPEQQLRRLFIVAMVLNAFNGSDRGEITGKGLLDTAMIPEHLVPDVDIHYLNALHAFTENTEDTLVTWLDRAGGHIGDNRLSRSAAGFADRLDRSIAGALQPLGEGSESLVGNAVPDFGLGTLVQGASDMITRATGLDSLLKGRLEPKLSWSAEGSELVGLGFNAPNMLSGLFEPIDGHVNIGGAQDKDKSVRVYTAGIGFNGERWDIQYVYVYRTTSTDDETSSSDQHLVGLTWRL